MSIASDILNGGGGKKDLTLNFSSHILTALILERVVQKE
jgi:hypothetical protein